MLQYSHAVLGKEYINIDPIKMLAISILSACAKLPFLSISLISSPCPHLV